MMITMIYCKILPAVIFIWGYLNKIVVSQLEDKKSVSITTYTNRSMPPLPCQYAPGLLPGERSRVAECCEEITHEVGSLWMSGEVYLTTYLETLKAWQCPQFVTECRERYLDFNEFTRLVYDYFCDYEIFVSKCIHVINDTYISNTNKDENSTNNISQPSSTVSNVVLSEEKSRTDQSSASRINASWLLLLNKLSSQQLNVEQMTIPCVQVALYQQDEAPMREYHEVVEPYLPFCKVTWCGYNGDALKYNRISLWNCMPSSCRAKTTSIMVICGLIGVIISSLNVIVILVYSLNPSLCNSQGIYRLSLAASDLLIGVVVFPTFITTLHRFTMRPQQLGELTNVTGYVINGTAFHVETTQVRNKSKWTESAYPEDHYVNVIGLFTMITLFAAVYTLSMAGFDRLRAVHRPLAYDQASASFKAKVYCVVIWLLSPFLASFPIFVPNLRYVVVASVVVSPFGPTGSIYLVIGFVIPLLLMWIVNGLTYYFIKRNSRIQKQHLKTSRTSDNKEAQLAITLMLMVGAFSISIVPAAGVVLFLILQSSMNFVNISPQFLTNIATYNATVFIAFMILACSSLWNFLIYSLRNLGFRKKLGVGFETYFVKLFG